MKVIPRLLPSGLLGLLLTGCATSAINIDPQELAVPQTWQSPGLAQPSDGTPVAEVVPGWLQTLQAPMLDALVQEGLRANFTLAEQRALVRQAEQSLLVAGAELYPELNLELGASRVRTASAGAQTGYDAGLDLGWELDLWGKLSDSERQANLTLAARRADLAAARLDLAGDLATAWFELQAVEQQRALFSRRLGNLQQNLEIIESGYRLGLNSALDVYLARNNVQAEQARVQAQTQLRAEAVQRLQLLLGRYPDGRWSDTASLPMIDTAIPAGVPAALLRRRPDLESAWMELLATDAALAIAHKARFPSLTISAGLSDTTTRLPDLLGGSLAWSLASGLTQPLFNAGRLRADEARARARVEQMEQQYLRLVSGAFSEVESALSRSSALQQQYEQYLQAERNALRAEELAFAQYRKGLVEYSTVLEAQRRSFDAQTTVIGLRADLLSNRIALHRALGGDFAVPAARASGAVSPAQSPSGDPPALRSRPTDKSGPAATSIQPPLQTRLQSGTLPGDKDA